MAELSRSSKYRATPDVPLTDAERSQLTERLNAAFERGEVSQDDYRVHLDTVFAARTLGEVAPVVEALPGVATHDVPAIVGVGAGRPGELSQARQPSTAMVAGMVGAAVVALMILALLLMLL